MQEQMEQQTETPVEGQRVYGFAVSRPIIIVQQPQNDGPPSPLEPAPPETKDLAPVTKPIEPQHLRRPRPEPAAVRVPPSIERHRRKCQICRHRDRDMIEEDFILWSTPRAISVTHRVPEMALYRHARAFNLFPARRESLRLMLDRVLERGPELPVTGDTIIRAVRAQACLTDDNHWVEPTKNVAFTNRTDEPEALHRSTASTLGREAPHRCADSPAASSRLQDAEPLNALSPGMTITAEERIPPVTAHN